jgi:uncharacterized protein (DUF2147 family)
VRPGPASLALALSLCATAAGAAPSALDGEWLVDGKVAVRMFPCGVAYCGKIVWLRFTKPEGQRFDHDKRNPDPALRGRLLCGLTILSGLRPDGPGRWKGGVFYNPRDGGDYRVNVRVKSPDVLSARFYVGVPLFGKTQAVTRFSPGGPAEAC